MLILQMLHSRHNIHLKRKPSKAKGQTEPTTESQQQQSAKLRKDWIRRISSSLFLFSFSLLSDSSLILYSFLPWDLNI